MPLARHLLIVLALLAIGLPASAEPGHYLVVELDAQGRAIPVFHRAVELAWRPTADAADISRARQHPERLAISGRGWSAVAEAPRFLRGEFAAEGHDGEIESHLVRAPRRSFVLRVPMRAGNRLALEFMGLRSELRLDRIIANTLALPHADALKSAPLASPPPNSGNRVDILVMGDGYTAAEQSKFTADAEDLRVSMFGMAPYQQYASFVNWTTQFTASAQSGADHPPYQAGCSSSSLTCCGDTAMQSDPRAGTFANTAFDGRFCTSGIHRLVVVNNSKILAAASAQPDWDEILVLVNDPVYGGSGGSFSVTTTHPSADLIVLHEYGHTFHRLADEYSSAYPGYPACNDIAGTPCEANVTNQSNASLLKWKDWLTPGILIPTPAGSAGVGLFQGARYQASGMYRSQNSCAMLYLGVPFCAVCAQEYVLRLYRGGFGVPASGIDLIEPGSESPSGAGSIAYTAGTTQVFSASILRPSPDTVSLQWYLDGVAIPGATSASYAFQQASGTPATRKLELLAFDNTPLVNANIATAAANIDAMSHWHTWNIAVASPPATLSIVDATMEEGHSGARAMVFNIALSGAATTDTSFEIGVRDLRSGGRSARQGIDYMGGPSSVMVIPAGQTSASFVVKIIGDRQPEQDEAFAVEIRNLVGAEAGRLQATGWIMDDDSEG